MKTVAAICALAAVLCVVAAAVGTSTPQARDCHDPPCGSLRDHLIIYGSYGAVGFGVLALGFAAGAAIVGGLRSGGSRP
jgi:Mn2+/Fe2+ NRAMP family transporter